VCVCVYYGVSSVVLEGVVCVCYYGVSSVVLEGVVRVLSVASCRTAMHTYRVDPPSSLMMDSLLV